ncbi:MAG: chemotaxis protein CheW [bacterium]|nr:chemotaxis protein CheW [bacterium]
MEKEKKITLPAYGLAEDIIAPPAPVQEKSTSPEDQAEPDAVRKYVIFFLGQEEYGLLISEVQEINRVNRITRVPNASAHIKGVINIRGKILPVIDLKKGLNLGETEIGKESRIVVVERGVRPLGLLVDRISQVLTIAENQMEKKLNDTKIAQGFIRGLAKLEGTRLVILLNYQEILGKMLKKA